MDENLVSGDKIEVQFPHAWSMVSGPTFTRGFQTTDSRGKDYITIKAPKAGVSFSFEIKMRQENCPEGVTRHGRLIVATIKRGVIPAGSPLQIIYANCLAPYAAYTEAVWIRVKGTAPEKPPLLITLPGRHKSFRVIVPSSAEPGDKVPVRIVSLDEFDNISRSRFSNCTLSFVGGKKVRNFSFTGFVNILVKLRKPGIYRFDFKENISNAIRVEKGIRGPFWGDIHIHSKLSTDAAGNTPYEYARDASGLDFAAVTDHAESIGPEGYRTLKSWRDKAHCEGKFVVIPADERNPRALGGHHNIYFSDWGALARNYAAPGDPDKRDARAESNRLQGLDPARAMLVPHHTGINFGGLPKEPHKGCVVDWESWADPGLRPVMEIYSHHGQSELSAPGHFLSYEFCRMRRRERRANVCVPGPYYAQNYWMSGKRIGVIASSDEHTGQGGRRRGGIAAVYADTLTTRGLFKALYSRHCYGTTGERILIDFTADGAVMGEVIKRPKGSLVKLRVRVWGTAILLRVTLLRHRFGLDNMFVPLVSDAPRPEKCDADYEFTETLTHSAVYYVHVVQEPLSLPDMGWTSPIWIELA